MEIYIVTVCYKEFSIHVGPCGQVDLAKAFTNKNKAMDYMRDIPDADINPPWGYDKVSRIITMELEDN